MSTEPETPSTKYEAYQATLVEYNRMRRDTERARKDAIDELLAQRKAVTQQLRQLGYEGEVSDSPRRKNSDNGHVDLDGKAVDPNAPIFLADTPTAETVMPNGKHRRRSKGAKAFSDAHCNICEMDGHDLRAHRGQATKKRFSAAELRSKGLDN